MYAKKWLCADCKSASNTLYQLMNPPLELTHVACHVVHLTKHCVLLCTVNVAVGVAKIGLVIFRSSAYEMKLPLR